jgi:FKBP-type peptidyl-prolyl cis-trans isomerase
MACNRKPVQLPANKSEQVENPTQQMLDYNKACLQAEMDEINAFLAKNEQFTACKDGWWLQVIKEGNGPTIQPMQTVKLRYQVGRLDGTVCYSSDTEGTKTLVVGKREWLQGIDLLLPTLTLGSEVAVIIPSRMAYGLRGKDKCITSYCPLLCKLQILE